MIQPVEVLLDLGQRHSRLHGVPDGVSPLDERFRVLQDQFGIFVGHDETVMEPDTNAPSRLPEGAIPLRERTTRLAGGRISSIVTSPYKYTPFR